MHRLASIGLSCVLSLLIGAGGENPGRRMQASISESASAPEPYVLVDALREISLKCDCVFTIEEGWKEGEHVNAIEAAVVGRIRQDESPREALSRLAAEVPHLRFDVD